MNSQTKKPSEEITQAVRQKYGDLARRQLENPGGASSCCSRSDCCGADSGLNETTSDLYAPDQILSLPDSVTSISLGCGNPAAIADLCPGQTVLDLGSGGGLDCFLAARQVGESGRVIGLDMTPAMLDLARTNAKKQGFKNVVFQYGYIEDIPLPDVSVDVIISNCVINLSPDKAAVFREAYRVLKPGGVLNVSDIVTHGDLPDELRGKLSAWAGCVSGALEEGEYLTLLRASGFTRVEVLERKYYPPEMLMEYPSIRALLADRRLLPADLNERIASITLQAFH